jgi:hypothetical protein
MLQKNCYFRGTFESALKVATFRGILIKSASKGYYFLGHFFKMPQNPSNYRQFNQSAPNYNELGAF